MNASTLPILSQSPVNAPRPTRGFAVCVAVSAVVAVAVAASLGGLDMLNRPNTTLITDQDTQSTSTVSGRSLDLLEPIYVRHELCPNQGLLAVYSEANSRGCLIADSKMPVSVIAAAINNRQVRVFEVDMETPEGTVEGWVESNDLRN